jgi:hypothetical protein
MNTRKTIALCAVTVIVAALASFSAGYWYSSLGPYVPIQFVLAGVWVLAAAMLVIRWRKIARLGVWLVVVLSAPFALLYPGQIVALLLSFALEGFV